LILAYAERNLSQDELMANWELAELQSIAYFQQVKPFFGGVQWPNEQDFSPDTLYLTSVAVVVPASVLG
jgi:hypothetical protein